jgi:hypothetical protein
MVLCSVKGAMYDRAHKMTRAVLSYKVDQYSNSQHSRGKDSGILCILEAIILEHDHGLHRLTDICRIGGDFRICTWHQGGDRGVKRRGNIDEDQGRSRWSPQRMCDGNLLCERKENSF